MKIFIDDGSTNIKLAWLEDGDVKTLISPNSFYPVYLTSFSQEVLMSARGINKVILVGRLGNDPEVRYIPNGGAVANLQVATSESWRDKQTGEMREQTEWHRVVLFGKLAEVAGEYLRKGAQVYIEGQLRTGTCT